MLLFVFLFVLVDGLDVDMHDDVIDGVVFNGVMLTSDFGIGH